MAALIQREKVVYGRIDKYSTLFTKRVRTEKPFSVGRIVTIPRSVCLINLKLMHAPSVVLITGLHDFNRSEHITRGWSNRMGAIQTDYHVAGIFPEIMRGRSSISR